MTPHARKLLPFLSWRRRVTRETLRADLVAGLIGALVVLPQGVAHATLAGLPVQYGLYCAMVPAVVVGSNPEVSAVEREALARIRRST